MNCKAVDLMHPFAFSVGLGGRGFRIPISLKIVYINSLSCCLKTKTEIDLFVCL